MTEVLKELTCKCCGAGLNPAEEKNGVIRCVYCGAAFVKEKPDCTPEIKNYLATAEAFLDTRKFDDALELYTKVSEKAPEEPKETRRRVQTKATRRSKAKSRRGSLGKATTRTSRGRSGKENARRTEAERSRRTSEKRTATFRAGTVAERTRKI